MTDALDPALLPGIAAEIGVILFVKGSLLLLGVWLIATATRGASAATRCGVWTAGLVGLLLIPFLPVAFPGVNLALVESPAAVTVGASLPALADPASSAVTQEGAQAAPLRAPGTGRGEGFTGLAAALVALWALGAGALLVRLAIDWVRVVGLTGRARRRGPDRDLTRRAVLLARRQGVQRPVRVVLSDQLHVPVTWGVWRPVVILPAEAATWERARLDAVLLHELAHVRRWDYPAHLLGEVARALYWPNPLAWRACRRSRVERERACDDTVLRFGTGSSDYARLLLDLARALSRDAPTVRGAMAMARPSMLETRIVGVLDRATNRGPTARRSLAMACALLITVMVPIGSVRVWASPPRTEADWIGALDRRDTETRLAAVEVLETLGSAGAVDALSGALEAEDPAVRHAAVAALGRIGDVRAIPALVGVVTGSHGDLHQKRLAATALSEIDDQTAVEALAAQGRGPESRGAARIARSREPHPSVWRPLVRILLEDPNPEARGLAASALVDIGCESAIPELLAATRDGDSTVRLAAVQALAEFDTWPVRRAMARLAEDDPDAEVRQAAVDVLEAC